VKLLKASTSASRLGSLACVIGIFGLFFKNTFFSMSWLPVTKVKAA